MSYEHVDDRLWRVSRSGYSIKTGSGDSLRIVAKYPGASIPLDTGAFSRWMDDAERICSLHNATVTPQRTGADT